MAHNDPSLALNATRTVSDDLDIEAQSSPRAPLDQKHVQIVEPTSSSNATYQEELGSPEWHARRTGSVVSRSTFKSLRKRGRGDTVNFAYSASEMGRGTGWEPGQEQGIDPSKEDDHDTLAAGEPHQLCEITCVDYSVDNMTQVTLDNSNLNDFLKKPQPDWAQVRWINVNGLSRDVVKAIGHHKHLHPLAIEDLMNTKSRTKADWYSDHTFIVLPLQKLVVTKEEHDSSDSNDSDDGEGEGESEKPYLANGELRTQGDEKEITRTTSERERRRQEDKHKRKRKGAIQALFLDIFNPKSRHGPRPRPSDKLTPATRFGKTSKNITAPWAPRKVRSLQRYQAGPNQDRVAYFERNAVFATRGLEVSMEQVSIFVTADNTVISFFEFSSQDIETPILRRLETPGTILRQAGDASMLMQSILDVIIDLAIPVTSAYQDALGDLELEVLTDPAIHESKILYILTSEISVLRNAIAPIAQLMSSLKDHKSKAEISAVLPSRSGTPVFGMPSNADGGTVSRPAVVSRHPSFFPGNQIAGVTISPLTVTYLSDVEDHVLLIQQSYDQMRRSADNLVDLIFNTVSAYQNESMKQLSIVTCFFLPLSFLTGYFGMNFKTFDAVTNNSDGYFWRIAAPVSSVVFMLLMRDVMVRWVVKWANKVLIARVRNRRLARRPT